MEKLKIKWYHPPAAQFVDSSLKQSLDELGQLRSDNFESKEEVLQRGRLQSIFECLYMDIDQIPRDPDPVEEGSSSSPPQDAMPISMIPWDKDDESQDDLGQNNFSDSFGGESPPLSPDNHCTYSEGRLSPLEHEFPSPVSENKRSRFSPSEKEIKNPDGPKNKKSRFSSGKSSKKSKESIYGPSSQSSKESIYGPSSQLSKESIYGPSTNPS